MRVFGKLPPTRSSDSDHRGRTLAITPSKSKSLPWDEVVKTCHDYTMTGLKAMVEARGSGKTAPLRFLYMSGVAAERDQTKTPRFMPKYTLLRVRQPCPPFKQSSKLILPYRAKQKTRCLLLLPRIQDKLMSQLRSLDSFSSQEVLSTG